MNIHFPYSSWSNQMDLGQSLAQENDCSNGSTCINSGSNNADININQHHGVNSHNALKIEHTLEKSQLENKPSLFSLLNILI